MLVPELSEDKPPNGVLIYFNEDTGHWVISANRFREIKIDNETHDALITQAKEFLRQAQESGLPVVDPDDDYEILSRLPKLGESTTRLESCNKEVQSLEEAASYVPKLWSWLLCIDEDFPIEDE
jgi:hypothetical protein